jgi:hypothetical protein
MSTNNVTSLASTYRRLRDSPDKGGMSSSHLSPSAAKDILLNHGVSENQIIIQNNNSRIPVQDDQFEIYQGGPSSKTSLRKTRIKGPNKKPAPESFLGSILAYFKPGNRIPSSFRWW